MNEIANRPFSQLHATIVTLIVKFHRDNGAWPLMAQVADLICRDRRDASNRMETLAKHGLVEIGVVEVPTIKGQRLAKVAIATAYGIEIAMQSKTMSTISSAPLTTNVKKAKLAKPARMEPHTPATEEDVRKAILASIREWRSIMNEWPTRAEVVQMVEEYESGLVLAQMRKLMKTHDVDPLLFVCPKTRRRETRYRVARYQSLIAA